MKARILQNQKQKCEIETKQKDVPIAVKVESPVKNQKQLTPAKKVGLITPDKHKKPILSPVKSSPLKLKAKEAKEKSDSIPILQKSKSIKKEPPKPDPKIQTIVKPT